MGYHFSDFLSERVPVPRSQPVIRVFPYRADWDADEPDVIERVSPSFPALLRLVLLFPDARKVIRGRGSRDFILALLVGVYACRSPGNAGLLRGAHGRLQYIYRLAPSPQIAQLRHETNEKHALGQLEALLVLGYCARLGVPQISKRLLRPFASRLVPRAALNHRLGPTQVDEGFDKWIDEVRNRVNRMRPKLVDSGEASTAALAISAIQKVDVFLRRTRNRPRLARLPPT